jgi:hypothetical protein
MERTRQSDALIHLQRREIRSATAHYVNQAATIAAVQGTDQ